MGQRYGTYTARELPDVIRAGVREAWRVSRLVIVVKVTDQVHGQCFQRESGWVIDALDLEPYEVIHQLHRPLSDAEHALDA
jgi:hypothetical protein